MKQDVSTPATSDKPEKNLYEPYQTPTLLWETMRVLAHLAYATVIRLGQRGRHNIPSKGPYILAANHLSWTDILLLPYYIPVHVVYMAKEEVFHSKLGWLARFLGAFPVKRGEADRQAMRTSATLLKAGKVLLIFPEGTRSLNHTLAKGHAGLGMIALRSAVPVIPVAIWGSEHALKKLGARVTISFGEPMLLKPKGAKITREDIENATEQVMHKIAELLPPEYRGIYAEQ